MPIYTSHETTQVLMAGNDGEMRFGGLSEKEIAEALTVSPETGSRDWRLAKSWLRRGLNETPNA